METRMDDEDNSSESGNPLDQPDQQTQEAVEPVKKELEEALRAINTPAKAEALVARLTADTSKAESEEVVEATPQPEGATEAVQAEIAAETVQKAAAVGEKQGEIAEAAAAIEAIAAEAATLDGPAYEAVVAAVQEVTNPALTGDPHKLEEPRRYLRDTIMNRMSFFQRYDTFLFIAINNGLHTPALNRILNAISFVFNGGWAWVIGAALFWPFRRERATQVLKEIAPPIWVAAGVVEGPIKKYFRRKRPFIDVVRAVVVGKKPGNWSFPSGHAAAAFAGARMLSRCVPSWRPLWYSLAALVGFSRVYLGAHYPGDIMSGSLLGMALAEGTRALMKRFGWWVERD